MIINLKDNVSVHDHNDYFVGEIIIGKNKKKVPYRDIYGNIKYHLDFDTVIARDHNIVTIGGYQFAFSKLFNIPFDENSTLRVGHLNDEAPQMKIGVPRAEYISVDYNAEVSTENSEVPTIPGINISARNYIFGFIIGDGAAREDNITAIAPSYKDRSLYHAIPFRMSNDGTKIPNGKYYGKAQTFSGSTGQEPIESYFIKKFESEPYIVHKWVTDDNSEHSVVDDTVFTSTSSYAIESYVEMDLLVTEDDARGYFNITNTSPRINEFGLVSGWYNPIKEDYESLIICTKLGRNNITLDRGDSIEAIYRLYAR